MKLYVFPPSPRAFKVLSVANHLGLAFETHLVDLSKGDHHKPEFAALNPNRRMPVLEDDGFVLWESNAIIQYLASKKPESGLLPTDPRGRADVSRWQFWDAAHWDAACAILGFERVAKKRLGLGDPDPVEIAKGVERFNRAAAVLDEQLKGHKFVTGDKLTLADFSLGAWMNVAQAAQYPVEPYREIRRWHAELSELPAWKKSFIELPPR
jgi:glutathione S-transferase